LAEAVDPACAVTGFWEIELKDMGIKVVARMWKASKDLGMFQFVGRGQCKDQNDRTYASLFTESGVSLDACKAACEDSAPCLAFEVTDLGACFLRYSVDDFPPEEPKRWLEEWGDDASGSIHGVTVPFDRYCYRKLDEDAGNPVKGSNGGYWRVMWFPKEDTTFYKQEVSTKEAPLEVGSAQPQDFPDCLRNGATVAASAPFASGLQVIWGLREMFVWAGVPSAKSKDHTWRRLNDTAAWDQTFDQTASRCPNAEDVTELDGQISWLNLALGGLGNCNAGNFLRLSPDTLQLDEGGWKQVVYESFRYGGEVFVRRMLFKRYQAVADEACFRALVDMIWDQRVQLTYAGINARLDASTCMTLVP